MRYVSVFSGIEAASVAWGPLGWEPVAFAEMEPFPCAVLARRFPDVPNLGDVTKVDWREFLETSGRPDVVVGGSPCQSFSVAGRREGLAGASGLMWEYVRAVQELRPRWLVWENVPGALSVEKGKAFGRLLRSMDECGYECAWRVLDAQFARVPVWDDHGGIARWVGPVAQRRRRLFLVGHLGDERAAEVLLEPEGMSGDRPSSREKREELAALAGRGAQGAGGDCLTRGASGGDAAGVLARAAGFKWNQGSAAGGVGYAEELSPTLRAGDSPSAVPAVAFAQSRRDEARLAGGGGMGVRRLTPLECERLQGFPDHYTDVPYRGGDHPPDTPRYKAIGNSMAVPVMRWIGERVEGVDA